MEIVTDKQSYTIAGSGALWGAIYIRHFDILFPEQGWNDLVLGVIEQWGMSIKEYIENEHTQIECRFMDGPYSFCCREAGDDFLIHLYSDGVSKRVIDKFTTDKFEFLESFVSIGGQVITAFNDLVKDPHASAAESVALKEIEATVDVVSSYLSKRRIINGG